MLEYSRDEGRER